MSKKIGQESQTIEWKWAWQDEFLKWLSGYANTDGGTLYIGVNDDGYVVGVEDAKRETDDRNQKVIRIYNHENKKILEVFDSLNNSSKFPSYLKRHGIKIEK